MNRRGFIASILAAPLAAWGYFAGNHSVDGTWVTFASDIHMGSFKNTTTMWMTQIHPNKDWMYITIADGKIIRHERWPGKKLPFVDMGDGTYEAILTAGDLCPQAKNKGTLLA